MKINIENKNVFYSACFFFSDDIPVACPCNPSESKWTILVRGDDQ